MASLLPFPDDLIQEIEQMIYEFLWNGKTHKVKIDVIIQDFKEEGHKMIDIRSLIMTQKSFIDNDTKTKIVSAVLK